MRGAIVVATAAVLVGACSLRGYPAPEPEICGNRLDEDFDGAVDCADPECAAACDEGAQCGDGEDDDHDASIDCADPDCDGAAECGEHTAALCADDRDNDLDGRVDARDAGCWPLASVEIERCASVLASAYELGPADFVGGAIEPDPLGLGVDLLAIPVGEIEPFGHAPEVRPDVMVTGALDGLHASFVVHVDFSARFAGVAIRLAEASRLRDPARLVNVEISRNVYVVGQVVGGSPVPLTPGPGVTRLAIDIDVAGQEMTISVDAESGSRATYHALLPSWSPTASMELGLAAIGTETSAGRVWLESAAVSAPRYERCGEAQPPIGITAGPVERADTALHDVARGDGAMLCALVSIRERDRYSLVGARSDDDGRSWRRGPPIASHDGTRSAAAFARAPALARDPVTGRWHAARLSLGTLEVFSSDDCLAWTAPALGAWDLTQGDRYWMFPIATPLEYRIGREEHVVTWLVGAEPGALTALSARSPWGDPDTWIVDAATDPDVVAPFDWEALGDRVPGLPARRQDLGAPVIVSPGASEVQVVTTSPLEPILTAIALVHSSEPGSFDGSGLVGPAFLIEDLEGSSNDVWSGRVFHSGLYDLGLDGGWGAARIRIRIGGSP